MPFVAEIAAAVSAATQQRFVPAGQTGIGGGCINQSFRLTDGARSYFVKTNQAGRLDMFAAEAEGLREILATQTIRAPRPICHGIASGHAFLVLEYLDLRGHGSPAEMGRQLAALHRMTAERFGWKRDNTIGSTPQHNNWTSNWIGFLRQHRFGHQLELARQNGISGPLLDLGARLLPVLDDFFPGYRPMPSLLHGDLWAGNAGFARNGEPVVFDPAVYYGDREADLAMTELFGGFDADFYAAYREAWPLEPGYPARKTLYNFYHILNHANLFGGGYIRQAEHMARSLLAAAGR